MPNPKEASISRPEFSSKKSPVHWMDVKDINVLIAAEQGIALEDESQEVPYGDLEAPIQVQAVIEGTHERAVGRNVLKQGQISTSLSVEKVKGTFAVRNEQTGEIRGTNAHAEEIEPTDYPHVKPGTFELFVDNTDFNERQLKAAYNHAPAKIHHSTDDEIRARGGDPTYRISKPDHSFSLGAHPAKLDSRKKKSA